MATFVFVIQNFDLYKLKVFHVFPFSICLWCVYSTTVWYILKNWKCKYLYVRSATAERTDWTAKIYLLSTDPSIYSATALDYLAFIMILKKRLHAAKILLKTHISDFYIFNVYPNKRNNTRKSEIRRIGLGNTLFYQTQIDENNFLKMYISVTRFPTKYKLLLVYMHINNNC